MNRLEAIRAFEINGKRYETKKLDGVEYYISRCGELISLKSKAPADLALLVEVVEEMTRALDLIGDADSYDQKWDTLECYEAAVKRARAALAKARERLK